MLRFCSSLLALLLLSASGALAQPDPSSPIPPDSGETVTAPTPDDPDETDWTTVRSSVEDRAADYVGAHEGHGALYNRESVIYRSPPPFRYNRVEGFVFGIGQEPLRFGENDDHRLYGQLAYATGLNDVRYTIGLESQLYATETTGLKLGAAYQEQTLSSDRWKTSYLENSLASAGFRHDFFDYHEAEGLSVYAVQDLPRSLQLTAGYRTEAHRALDVETNWSLFGSGSFRTNPAVKEGRLQAIVASLTGGQVTDREDLPEGKAFRLAATVADGMGGDFSFYQYEGDARIFLPLTSDTRLGLRLRGGYATSGTPPQYQFALGGIGSLRSYDQNAFRGTRTLLANAEYLIDGASLFDDVLDDLFVAGLLDAGWVGGPTQSFRVDDVLPAAGFGIGLDEREVRLDITWPLRDGTGAGSGPSIWLRITPNF